MSGAPSRLCGEAGFAGGGEVLPFGVLTFVVGTLLVANAWAAVDAKFAVSSAAREAARAYVEAPDAGTAEGAARAAAVDALAGLGRDPSEVRVVVEVPGGFARCARVTVDVSYPVPTVRLPWIGGLGALDVHDRHTEVIDPFRDDLPAGGRCG